VSRPTSVPERREWDRLAISVPFFVRGRTATSGEFLKFATALDLSAGGVLLAILRYLEPGTEVSLEIPVALVNKAQLPRSVSLLHATALRCGEELFRSRAAVQGATDPCSVQFS
jgi:hypothetical protein